MVDLPEKIERRLEIPIQNCVSVGVSWIEGSLIFKEGRKWSNAWYGICHYQLKCAFIFPKDMFSCTQLKSIEVSLAENYCAKSGGCLNLKCVSSVTGKRINNFSKSAFAAEFKDVGLFSLALPSSVGTIVEDLWFNSGGYPQMWRRLIEPYTPEGVVLSKKTTAPLV
jgi:hypothetical protein